MKSEPLYEQICVEMQRKIDVGELLPGEKAPSIAMIRKEFAVSAVTAVHALKKLHVAGILERKFGRGYFVADSVRCSKVKNLCVGCLLRGNFISDTDHFFNDIIGGIQQAAMLHKVNLLWSYLAQNISKKQTNLDFELLMVAQEINKQVSGFLIDERVPDLVIREIINKTGKPVVVINRTSALPVYSVSSNYRSAMIKLADMLQKMKYNRFIFFASGGKKYSDREKLAGFREAAKKFGWSDDQYHILPDTCLVSSEETYRNFEAIRQSMLSGQIAVITDADISATILFDQLQEKGISVPKDVGIVATDGIALSRLHKPEISTIQVNTENIGRTALELLVGVINEHNHETDKCTQIKSVFNIGETI